jgi:hypothetical protein
VIIDDKSIHKSYEWYESRVVHELGVQAIAVYEYLYTYSYASPKGRVANLKIDEIMEATSLSKGATNKALKLLETVDFVSVGKSDSRAGAKSYNLSSYIQGDMGLLEYTSGVAYVAGIHHKICAWAKDNDCEDPDEVPTDVATRICREVLYAGDRNDKD